MENEQTPQIDPVIEVLQNSYNQELHAIHQYVSFHRQLEFLSYTKLADIMKDISIVEMQHSDELATRIKILLHEPENLSIGELADPGCALNIFNTAAELEKKAVSDYNEAIIICDSEKDAITSDIFLNLLKDEEKHLNIFLKIAGLISELGEAYLVTQANALISNIKQNS